MCPSSTYRAIDKECNAYSEQTQFFMMNSLLYSRMESGFPSNDEYFDEDVNVYLANLLANLIDQKCHKMLDRYILQYDISIFERVDSIDNPRTKYMIYKTNADFLLVSLGIFGNPRRMRTNSVPYMKISDESYAGRGKAYYNLARSYSIETFRRNTAIGEIMGKLSRGFEKYTKILSLMRGEYFNMHKRITNGEIYHLERSVDLIEQKGKLTALYDKFLDTYSSYKRRKTPRLKKLLEGISAEIRELDPSFKFSTD